MKIIKEKENLVLRKENEVIEIYNFGQEINFKGFINYLLKLNLSEKIDLKNEVEDATEAQQNLIRLLENIKDLFNKDNIEKVVNAVTGNQTIDMTGTWTYSGSAIEFESDNLLQKAGGAAAAAVAEKKLDEQLAKVGIKDGQVSFTFNADSTFTSTVGKRTMTGTYSYDATDKVVHLRYFKLLNMNAKVNCTSTNMDLLFNSDKLLKLIAFISSKSSSTTLKTISSLADSYDGMMLGFALKK